MHEISRKPSVISLDLLIQPPGANSIQFGEVVIQENLPSPNSEDEARNIQVRCCDPLRHVQNLLSNYAPPRQQDQLFDCLIERELGLLKEHGEIGRINIAPPRQLVRKLESESHAVFVVMREVAQKIIVQGHIPAGDTDFSFWSSNRDAH